MSFFFIFRNATQTKLISVSSTINTIEFEHHRELRPRKRTKMVSVSSTINTMDFQHDIIDDADDHSMDSVTITAKNLIISNALNGHNFSSDSFQIAWSKIELKRPENLKNDSLVLVKWPCFPYWPARVTSVTNKKVDVIFFGDNKWVILHFFIRLRLSDTYIHVNFILFQSNSQGRSWKNIWF